MAATTVAIALISAASVIAAPTTASATPSTASATPTKAHPASYSYVALGDSFSAGQGSQTTDADYITSSGACARYTTAFPNLVAAKSPRHIDLTSVACSGARVPEVASSQLSFLRSTNSLVTLTVGGNDAGFAPVALACAQQTYCQSAIQKSSAFITYQLPSQLAQLYRGVRQSAPNAHLVVLGYPNLFGAGPCTEVGQYLSATVRQQLDSLADQLDQVIASVAKSTGATFVDVRHAFTGHGVCGTAPWINGIGSDEASLLHPNTAGQQAYAVELARAVPQIKLGVPPRFSANDLRKLTSMSGHRFSRSFAATAGTKPLSYSIAAGALPMGVHFDPTTGVIFGTARYAGHFAFTWVVTNAYGTASSDFTWTVKQP